MSRPGPRGPKRPLAGLDFHSFRRVEGGGRGERRMNRSCEPVPPTDTPAAVAQTAIRKFRQPGGEKKQNNKDEDSASSRLPKQAERDFLSLFGAINGGDGGGGGAGAGFFSPGEENISV